MGMCDKSISEQCREKALELGFDLCGFSSVDVSLRRQYYKQWIAEGQHAGMGWMERNNDRRMNPEKLLEGAHSIVMLGMNYHQPEPEMRGRIAKYALGKDYHKIVFKKAKQLCTWMREQGGAQKPYVDTGPVLEKPLAANAGLGWQGKSTLLINQDVGPWMFLASIVTTLELDPDKKPKDRCGSCTRCIDVCPTNAITAPFQLDSRKCISYMTIEHQGVIPVEFRKLIGDHVFGCDDCLDVCPWNRLGQVTRESRFLFQGLPDLRDTLEWDEEQFRERFQGTPIMRLKLARWKRNVCVVLGNIGEEKDLYVLKHLAESDDEMVGEHAAWAVEMIEARN